MSLFLVLTALIAFLLPHVLGCSCPRTDFQGVYFTSIKRGTPISRVKVLSSLTRNSTLNGQLSSPEKEVLYKLRVSYVFTNCAPRRSYIAFAVTSADGGVCGVSLEVGSDYLVQLKVGPRKVTAISLCGVNILLRSLKRRIPSRLTTEQRRVLLTRRLCCGRRCRCALGRRPFFRRCLGTPCRNAKKPCAEATKCVTNYCDGCNAEWFKNDGLPACLPDFGEQLSVAGGQL